ncbi:MAG: DUF3108 domain-containing protein [Alphaproteobacteria bacterium]
MATALLLWPQISSADSNTPQAQGTTQNLVYEVYAGGVHAVQSKVRIQIGPDGHYDMNLHAYTRGFLAKILPWDGLFETHGQTLADGRHLPASHKSTRVWKDETDMAKYLFKPDGSLEKLTIHDYGKKPYERDLEEELTTGTIDVLTAVLAVLEDYNESGKCAGRSEVFDGKRRFEQVFTDKGTVELEPSAYNIYGGPAAKCTVEVIPVSGRWHKKPRGWLYIQEQGRKLGMMPTLWIAQIDKDGPAVPVKIHIKTIYGSMFMHLAEYDNGQNILVADRRMREADK